MAISIADLYIRFETLLYLVLAIGGFAAPGSMLQMFNVDLTATTTEPQGIDLIEGHQYVSPLTALTGLAQMYTYLMAIVSLQQCVTLFLAIKSQASATKTHLVRMNILLNVFLIVYNGWIISTQSALYSIDGLYYFKISFGVYIVDFLILLFLTEIQPFIFKKSSSSSTTPGSTKTSKKNK
ncbi:hypothetical protein DFA_07548 [Cavenderia fasciculata]|uniref:Transmembrane protein n=1 Tax=Cavenderia fasciculata TaxID=261658 RepID=F4PWR0_CACFS|nr:uncharacterized protein DFA_07548 [Cavenderia fasciculata]EGG20424.1 hypothetical protein DFA_07548 [Cavenderia fasciculata]|eukprot:XP_004367407.1 hypothetical protein DFA_07548 [Cavenderia fasciculata]